MEEKAGGNKRQTSTESGFQKQAVRGKCPNWQTLSHRVGCGFTLGPGHPLWLRGVGGGKVTLSRRRLTTRGSDRPRAPHPGLSLARGALGCFPSTAPRFPPFAARGAPLPAAPGPRPYHSSNQRPRTPRTSARRPAPPPARSRLAAPRTTLQTPLPRPRSPPAANQRPARSPTNRIPRHNQSLRGLPPERRAAAD